LWPGSIIDVVAVDAVVVATLGAVSRCEMKRGIIAGISVGIGVVTLTVVLFSVED